MFPFAHVHGSGILLDHDENCLNISAADPAVVPVVEAIQFDKTWGKYLVPVVMVSTGITGASC